MKRRNFILSTAATGIYLGFSSFLPARKTHVLTLSFDDGFKKSFYRISEMHEAYGLKACLNVIATGHMKSFNAEPKWISGEVLGSFDDWNRLRSRGHEVMPHSWEHRNLTEIPPGQAMKNMDKCFDYFAEHLEGYRDSEAVYNFAYNASTPELEAYALERVRAVRTGAWLVLKDKRLNPIPVSKDSLRLGCDSYGPDNADQYVEKEVNQFLAGPGGWLILNLHGLDEEGWGPVSSSYLDGLLRRLVEIDKLDYLPTGEVLKKYA